MFSYGNPVCPITDNKAVFFCCSQNCTLPAFACQNDCLIEHGHSNHTTGIWGDIQQSIRQITEVTLSKEELQQLERQQKQIKIVAEELKAIMESHWKYVIQCKKRLRLKQNAEKVVSAVRDRKTNGVTGNDMANLLKDMQTGDTFSNKSTVFHNLIKRNELINKLISELKTVISVHKQRETALQRPQQIKNDDKLTFTIDTANSNAAVIENGSVTVRMGTGKYQPVFAAEQLISGQSYEVQIVYSGKNRSFMIGVATADLRNRAQAQAYLTKSSLCIYGYDGRLYSEGKWVINNLTIETGQRVVVRHTGQQIEWMRGQRLLCAEPLSNQLNDAPIFPVLWIYSSKDNTPPSKLRFV